MKKPALYREHLAKGNFYKNYEHLTFYRGKAPGPSAISAVLYPDIPIGSTIYIVSAEERCGDGFHTFDFLIIYREQVGSIRPTSWASFKLVTEDS